MEGSNTELQRIFVEVDYNGDGLISKDEFLSLLIPPPIPVDDDVMN